MAEGSTDRHPKKRNESLDLDDVVKDLVLAVVAAGLGLGIRAIILSVVERRRRKSHSHD